MDAHVFRPLAAALGQTLAGSRVEKIFRPVQDHWSFVLGGRSKHVLLLRAAKADGVVFVGAQKPVNPLEPPAEVMWLRKRLTGRRLLAPMLDWPGLRLAWGLSPASGAGREFAFLVLDLRQGPSLAAQLDPAFGQEPEWPEFSRVVEDDDVWREYPHISPPLRKALKAQPQDEAKVLYRELEAGPAAKLYVRQDERGHPTSIAAWPLAGEGIREFDDPLEAGAIYGQPRYFAGLGAKDAAEDKAAHKAHAKRIKRSLAHLEKDEQRLAKLAGAQAQAEALQAELYRFADGPTPERVTVEHPAHGEMTVELNTTMTVAENMERLFRQAAKGKRGLAAVAERRAQLADELENPPADLPPAKPQQAAKKAAKADKRPQPGKLAGLNVRVFTTSDGFTVVRGKSSTANHQLLSRAASPFDLWFHAAGRPGAHVVLKRDHPSQEVPRQSLEQAAVLAGLSSGYAGEAKADVLCALIKDVRKIKGAAHGMVRVDQVQETLRVELDEGLPDALGS